MKRLVVFALFLFTLIVSAFKLQAQVSIAPTALFIDSRTAVGNLYILNRSGQTQEVNIDFRFGYPTSDSIGNLVMTYDDSIAFERQALDPIIRAFPRSFIIEPDQQQTVRVQVRPKSEMENGFYYTRVRVLSNPVSPDIDEVSEGLTTRINFRFEQVIAAFYKKGYEFFTSLDLLQFSYTHDESKLTAVLHLQQTGNSPFLGSVIANLYDRNGTLVKTNQSTIAGYFLFARRVELDIDDLEDGVYNLEIQFKTERSDISPNDIVQSLKPLRFENLVELNRSRAE
jgi:hypothetical protein